MAQLPTGSCVLKLGGLAALIAFYAQLPTGSCVLKPLPPLPLLWRWWQLPTGSCVLKQLFFLYRQPKVAAATYG